MIISINITVPILSSHSESQYSLLRCWSFQLHANTFAKQATNWCIYSEHDQFSWFFNPLDFSVTNNTYNPMPTGCCSRLNEIHNDLSSIYYDRPSDRPIPTPTVTQNIFEDVAFVPTHWTANNYDHSNAHFSIVWGAMCVRACGKCPLFESEKR